MVSLYNSNIVIRHPDEDKRPDTIPVQDRKSGLPNKLFLTSCHDSVRHSISTPVVLLWSRDFADSTANMRREEATKEVVCVPGQRLCLADEKTLTGQGTYEKSGYIYAMLAGYVQIREEDKVCAV